MCPFCVPIHKKKRRIFGEVAVDLRKALANLAKKMATARCEDIEALIAR